MMTKIVSLVSSIYDINIKGVAMKTAVFITALILLTSSLVLAETYKWEDENGMHFTENANSIPKKYRARSLAEARGDITMTDPGVASEVQRSDSRSRAIRQEDERYARREASDKERQDIARKLAQTECTGIPGECGPGRACLIKGISLMGRVEYEKTGVCMANADKEREIAENRADRRARAAAISQDSKLRDINNKLDSIDRKLPLGW
jgi:hypothetical protein